MTRRLKTQAKRGSGRKAAEGQADTCSQGGPRAPTRRSERGTLSTATCARSQRPRPRSQAAARRDLRDRPGLSPRCTPEGTEARGGHFTLYNIYARWNCPQNMFINISAWPTELTRKVLAWPSKLLIISSRPYFLTFLSHMVLIRVSSRRKARGLPPRIRSCCPLAEAGVSASLHVWSSHVFAAAPVSRASVVLLGLSW